ncbi:ribonuclease Z [Chitinophaga terrae (ex Kim and Jung 2007)]|uniref:ribonuclease Z n=1 Tax=Chitinophaga terrae (ex Kim and Jung 2007) TaxID=408074 RepID=UPI00278A0CCF|nr:ribonuclease Z [Chitinophaga terrae (ex Kim and Jung 2007)]MDQ0108346.1 ribonuclease Z [Chitinophaga terrae (ex Kim and Jung 2007)]
MFAVTILGNNSAIPTLERHPTAQVVTCNEQLCLVDCGEGTQLQIAKYKIKRSRLRYIFISHLHGDHYFGLIGLLNTLNLLGRTEPLSIYGPAPLEQIIQLQLDSAETQLKYELSFVPLTPGYSGIILTDKELQVSCFPTQHRIPCFGFSFEMQKRKRKLLPDQARAYEIPAAYFSKLQDGEDYRRKDGTIVKNDWVTLPPPPAKRYVYCADTIYDTGLLRWLEGADLMYHETTYLHELHERAAERYHSTAVQAASLAAAARVKQLLIGHFSSKYTELGPFLEESRPIFERTAIAEEGVTFLV